MAQVLTALVAFALFLGILAVLRRRGGDPEPVAWGWLPAIVACAAVAVIVGLVAR